MAETYRSIKGEIKLLEQTNDFLFPIEIWAYNDKLTLNGWRFTNLEEHREKWTGIPVLCAYVNGGHTIGSGHNQQTKRTKDGEEYQSFVAADSERIVGATSDEENDIRIESDGENKWLVAKATLYRWYARELTDYIVSEAVQGGFMEVSIEALVTESHMEGDVEVEDAYVPLGITLLGRGVAPAVPGAHVAMLTEMESEFMELKLRAASYQNQSDTENKPENPDKKGMSASMKLSKKQRGELQPKFGDNKLLAAEQFDDGSVLACMMTPTGATAVYLMESIDDAVYDEKIQIVNAQVHFCADGKEDVCVDACDLTELAAENAKECLDRAECAEKELKECKAEIDRMVAIENARRLSAGKKAAADALDAFNSNRDEKVSADALKALSEDIEAGKFTALCDENGVWNGDNAIVEKVLAICAKADMDYQKKLAEKRAEFKPMSWGSMKQASASPGTVGELLAATQNN